MRIFLCGPSGVGKTTLSVWAEKEFNVPFVATSTKVLWEKHKIKNHSEIITRTIVNPQWGYDFQLEALEIRNNLIDTHREFITDRSLIDNLVYFNMQVVPFVNDRKVEEYISLVTHQLERLNGPNDSLIHLPFNNLTALEDDGMRIHCRAYQEFVQMYFYRALREMHVGKLNSPLKFGLIDDWDFEKRKERFKKIIWQK